jgi:hypothetical protein
MYKEAILKEQQRHENWNTAEYATVVESSSGIGSYRNGKKGIRLCQEDFTSGLKLQ